jgi:hypothetical protein
MPIVVWLMKINLSSAVWFGTKFRVFFSSAEGFEGKFREYFLFCLTEWNSEFLSLPLKRSEGNSESLLLFLFNGTEFRVVFSSSEGFGTEFREFLLRGTAGIPSEVAICSVYSVFRGIIFLSEIPNPSWGGVPIRTRGLTLWYSRTLGIDALCGHQLPIL